MENTDKQGQEIFTLGLSNREPARVLELLAGQGITALVDVRSRPYSKYASWYNKAELEGLIKGAGLAYVYLGRELGGMPEDPALLGPDHMGKGGKPDYGKIAASPAFAQGLDRLLHGLAKGWRICLACAEADPSHCHRQQLIAPALELRGVRVVHIMKDGGLMDWRELRERERQAARDKGMKQGAEQGRLPV